MRKLLQFGLFAAGLAVAGTVQANKLIAAAASEPTSVDPYFHNLSPNNVVAAIVFDTLVYSHATEGLKPRLATSWQQLPGDRVRINLRRGVKYHDGSDFTANDVVYSACRISRVENSPSSLAIQISDWQDIEVVDDYTIIVQKTGASPMLMAKAAAGFFIISDSIAGSAKVDFNGGACDGFKYVETVEFEAGDATVGTGPYKLSEYTKGEKIVYTKFARYWGNYETGGNQPAQYDTLEIRPIKAAGARVAALIAGDVDMIEQPTVQDLPRLEKNPNISVAVTDSNRSIYVMFGMTEQVPDVEGTNGKNPFLDKRVRTALSLAIHRELLVDRIMGPLGIPATNIAPIGMFGIDPVEGYRYDPARAKQLLAEAGYPNGFTVTLGAPNDRYINDAKLAQAIAQMWTQIGVKTKVTAVTRSVFFGNRNKGMYPVWLAGWGDSLFDGESFVKALSATVNKGKKWGASNKGGYSHTAIDALVDQMANVADSKKRWQLISGAAAIVLEEKNWIATHYQIFPLALNSSVSYNPPAGGERTDYRAVAPAK